MKVPAALLLQMAVDGTLAMRERSARKAIERLGAAALETLLNAIEANDADTGMHVRRVATYAAVISDAADLSERERHGVERVALFHDIGKIYEALFDIVHDAAKLTPAQRREVATHPARGAEVLAPLGAFYPELPRGALTHHERWDGSGYPRGLRGKQIPIEARIVSIADTFDSVSHRRRYRDGAGFLTALDVIAEGRGTQFDPELVDLVLFPPVTQQLVRARVRPSHHYSGRRTGAREEVPDISFRWRSDLPPARRVPTPRGV